MTTMAYIVLFMVFMVLLGQTAPNNHTSMSTATATGALSLKKANPLTKAIEEFLKRVAFFGPDGPSGGPDGPFGGPPGGLGPGTPPPAGGPANGPPMGHGGYGGYHAGGWGYGPISGRGPYARGGFWGPTTGGWGQYNPYYGPNGYGPSGTGATGGGFRRVPKRVKPSKTDELIEWSCFFHGTSSRNVAAFLIAIEIAGLIIGGIALIGFLIFLII